MPDAVSIIIPVYNEEGAIASTLASIDATMRGAAREYAGDTEPRTACSSIAREVR